MITEACYKKKKIIPLDFDIPQNIQEHKLAPKLYWSFMTIPQYCLIYAIEFKTRTPQKVHNMTIKRVIDLGQFQLKKYLSIHKL